MKRPSAIKNRWIKVWNAAREQLEERGDWDETAAALLERFVLNLMEAENALKQASAEPFIKGGAPDVRASPEHVFSDPQWDDETDDAYLTALLSK